MTNKLVLLSSAAKAIKISLFGGKKAIKAESLAEKHSLFSYLFRMWPGARWA